MQSFFRPPALGDIDHGAHVFNDIAGWTENGMACRVDVLDLAGRMDDSVIQFVCDLPTACSLSGFPDVGSILRMDALQELFESRWSAERFKTQYPVAFFGPVP